MVKYILAADVGGTKTNIGVFSSDAGCTKPVQLVTYASCEFKCLEDLLSSFMANCSYSISGACFGVAGPVLTDRVTFTNLPWQISKSDLQNALATRNIEIVNDMVALGYGLPFLAGNDLVSIQDGQPADKGTIALVAPGTGLGMAFKVWSDGEYICYPSEGGHGLFSPVTPEQYDLYRKLSSELTMVHCEDVCSGPGIARIYKFLMASGHYGIDEDLSAVHDHDFTPEIIEQALMSDKGPCYHTLNLFYQILAIICRNLALTLMATGGVFIGGGIIQRITSILDAKIFMKHYVGNDKFSPFLSSTPVMVIGNHLTPLLGAAKKSFGQD